MSKATVTVKASSGTTKSAPQSYSQQKSENVGISGKIAVALLAAGRVDPAPQSPIVPQPVELHQLPNKKPRTQAIITKLDRPSVSDVVEKYKGRIASAAETDPDSVHGIQVELDGIIAKIVEDTQAEFYHNQDEIDKANAYNETLETLCSQS